jgi:hypothetical protein
MLAAPPEAIHSYSRQATNGTGLRASDICLSCRMRHAGRDALEAVKAWRPTRLEWSYIDDPVFVEAVQASGAVYVAALNTISQRGPEYVSQDFEGGRLIAPWMTEFRGGEGADWMTVAKPAVLDAALARVERLGALGVRSFQHDDWAYNAAAFWWGGGDFSEESLSGFRDYLDQHGEDDALAAADRTSWEGFNYRDYLRENFGWTTTAEYVRNAKKDPLSIYWRSYHRDITREYFEQLLKQGAERIGGAMHLAVNDKPHAFQKNFLLDLLDYQVGEFGITENFEDDLAHALAVADALNMPQVVSPHPREEPDPDLVRRGIARTYAGGHRMLVPYDVWISGVQPRWFGEVETYGDLYDFVRANARLLDGYHALIEARFFLYSPRRQDLYESYSEMAREWRAKLARAGYPLGYAVGGLAGTIVHVPIDPGDFENVAFVVNPVESIRWVGNDGAAFDAAAEGVPVIDPETKLLDVVDLLGPPLWRVHGGEVDVVPRTKPDDPDAPVVVHLVSRQKAEQALEIGFDERFVGRQPWSVTLHAPGAETVELTAKTSPSGWGVRVPRLEEWAILEIEREF